MKQRLTQFFLSSLAILFVWQSAYAQATKAADFSLPLSFYYLTLDERADFLKTAQLKLKTALIKQYGEALVSNSRESSLDTDRRARVVTQATLHPIVIDHLYAKDAQKNISRLVDIDLRFWLSLFEQNPDILGFTINSLENPPVFVKSSFKGVSFNEVKIENIKIKRNTGFIKENLIEFPATLTIKPWLHYDSNDKVEHLGRFNLSLTIDDEQYNKNLWQSAKKTLVQEEDIYKHFTGQIVSPARYSYLQLELTARRTCDPPILTPSDRFPSDWDPCAFKKIPSYEEYEKVNPPFEIQKSDIKITKRAFITYDDKKNNEGKLLIIENYNLVYSIEINKVNRFRFALDPVSGSVRVVTPCAAVWPLTGDAIELKLDSYKKFTFNSFPRCSLN